MIPSLFQAVFSASIQMTFPIFIVLLSLPFLRKYVCAKTLFKIEKMLFVGLAVSLIISYIGPLIQISVSSPEQSLQQLLDVNNLSLKDIEKIPPKVVNRSRNALYSKSNFNIHILGYLWFTGALSIVIFTVSRYVLFIWTIRNNSCAIPSDFVKLYQQQCRELKIKHLPDIKLSTEIPSPITIGWFHPTIVLAPQNLSNSHSDLELLFRHELCHCQQKDNFWRVFVSLILSIYWFHPLIWYLFYSFSLENEMCCDEKVLQGKPMQARKLYAELLLFSAEEKNILKSAISLQSGLKSNAIAMKLRIQQIKLAPSYHGTIFLYLYLFGILLFSGMISVGYIGQATASQRITIPVFNNHVYISTNTLGNHNLNLPNDSRQVSKTKFPSPVETETTLSRKYLDENGLVYRDVLHFFVGKPNAEVVACIGGTIAAVQTKDTEELTMGEAPLRTFGKCVVIDCGDGLSVCYAFLDSIAVEPGQKVSIGDVLGTAGHTGLSYGNTDQCGILVMQDGVIVDPLPFFEINTPIQESILS